MKNISFEINGSRLKSILMHQAILEIIMTPEEDAWLRLVQYVKDEDKHIDRFRIDNGSGDHVYVSCSEAGVIIKGFDHESPLSPYASENQTIADGIYDTLPPELLVLLDECTEKEDVTFCLWQRAGEDHWTKEQTIHEDAEDGQDWLLQYIAETSEAWQEWAEGYYERECDLAVVKQIYDGTKLTPTMIRTLNVERDVQAVMNELKVSDLG